MSLKFSELTPERLAGNVFRMRDFCIAEMEKETTAKEYKSWSKELAKIEKMIGKYGLNRYSTGPKI